MKQLECVCSYCGSTKTICEKHYEDKKGATHTTRTYFNKHTCKDCGCEWLTVRGDSRSILSGRLVATYWILGFIFILLSTCILKHYGLIHNKDGLMGYSSFTGVIYVLFGFYLMNKTEDPDDNTFYF